MKRAHLPSLTFLLMACLTPLASAAEEPAISPVEKTMMNPPATGLLVTFVGPGTQAGRLDMRLGDVIVSYAGKDVADLETLAALKKKTSPGSTVECTLVRDDKRIVVQLEPGPLGVNLTQVSKGKAPQALPAPTLKRVDLSSVNEHPRETWYSFSLDGQIRVGFEHGLLSLEDGKYVLRREVAFDGGEAWGKNHMIVTAVVSADGSFQPVSTSYENGLNGWLGHGARKAGTDGKAIWEATWPPVDGEAQGHRVGLPTDLPVIPSYLVEAVAAHMPREAGACFHLRQLNEGMGRVDMPTALYVVGEMALEHEGKEVRVWQIDLRKLGGGASSSFWVAADGRVLKISYGGAFARYTTKEKALAGLPEGIGPKTPKK